MEDEREEIDDHLAKNVIGSLTKAFQKADEPPTPAYNPYYKRVGMVMEILPSCGKEVQKIQRLAGRIDKFNLGKSDDLKSILKESDELINHKDLNRRDNVAAYMFYKIAQIYDQQDNKQTIEYLRYSIESLKKKDCHIMRYDDVLAMAHMLVSYDKINEGLDCVLFACDLLNKRHDDTINLRI